MKLGRIFVIALLAPIFGIFAYLASDALFPEADASAPLSVWFVVILLVWAYAAAISVVSGMLLHVAIIRWRLPPPVILLLFLLAAGAITWLFTLLPGISIHLAVLSIGTGVSAWAMYCYGPFKLLQRQAHDA